MQLTGGILLWARDFTDQRIGSWTLPALYIPALHALLVLLLMPLLNCGSAHLRSRGCEPSPETKMCAGMLAIAGCFAALTLAALRAQQKQVSAGWVVLALLLLTAGETSLLAVAGAAGAQAGRASLTARASL